MKEKLQALFESYFGEPVKTLTEIGAHASARNIYRLAGATKRCIGVWHQDKAENTAFVQFTRHFHKHQLPVPEILAEKLADDIYIEEDLGDLTLLDVLNAERQDGNEFPEMMEALYYKVVKILPLFQVKAGTSINYDFCCGKKTYDRSSMIWDMHYFRDQFLKRIDVPFTSGSLEKEFQTLADAIEETDGNYFMYRDFQSRNIMLNEGKLYFIDYQGGRRGPLQYDIASLLYQGQARIPEDARQRIFEIYMNALGAYVEFDRKQFEAEFYSILLLRLFQVLGTYGLRGLSEGKEYFIQSIPFGIENLVRVLHSGKMSIELPELSALVEKLAKVSWGKNR